MKQANNTLPFSLSLSLSLSLSTHARTGDNVVQQNSLSPITPSDKHYYYGSQGGRSQSRMNTQCGYIVSWWR